MATPLGMEQPEPLHPRASQLLDGGRLLSGGTVPPRRVRRLGVVGLAQPGGLAATETCRRNQRLQHFWIDFHLISPRLWILRTHLRYHRFSDNTSRSHTAKLANVPAYLPVQDLHLSDALFP